MAGEADPLKEMLVNYMVTNVNVVGPSELFKRFLTKGGSFAGLFWITAHTNLMVAKGSRGWPNGTGWLGKGTE